VTDVLSPSPKQQFLDSSGSPAAGWKLFTYAAGTSTKLATHTDSTGLSNNTNPIILDYRGEANIWIPPNVAYKYILAPPSDTDPPTHAIWTVDRLVASQLITLYGGVDTGAANAYVLTFTANFSAYTDGTVIYWVPANANTGASTINVNGLGIISIVNQNGSALTAGQLVANQVAVIIYKGGSFLLISSGLVSSAAQTIFVARRNSGGSAQTLTNNAITTIIFDTEDTDQGGNYNNATGVFTAPIAGVYTFSCDITVTGNASAAQLPGDYYFSKNNSFVVPNIIRLSGIFPTQASGSIATASQTAQVCGTATFQMNAGDTMRVQASQPNNGGGAFTLSLNTGRNNFYGYKVG
jgi:hypothetical protein